MKENKHMTLDTLLEDISSGIATPESIVERCHYNYKIAINNNVMISEKYNEIYCLIKSKDSEYKLQHKGHTLYGIPVVVKDNIHVKYFSNTAGTLALSNFFPNKDAIIIEKLKSHGAIIVGKSNMHELSLGATSHNCLFGHVKNAHNPSLIAGGSSGGSAVAVAMGLSPIAIGTDTAGSVRIPAALNGVVGFRPSLNRYSTLGVTPVTPSRDVPGIIAASVKDIQIVDALLCDEKFCTTLSPSHSKRIGIVRDFFFNGVDDKILAIVEKRIDLLKANGFDFIELDFPELNELNDIVGTVIGFYEFWPAMSNYLKNNHPETDMTKLVKLISSNSIKQLLVGFMSPDATFKIDYDYYNSVMNNERIKLIDKFSNLFIDNDIDAIAFPTTIALATEITSNEDIAILNRKEVSSNYAYLRNTLPASNAGLPAITIPAGKTHDNYYVGFELNGAIDNDIKLISLAEEIESFFISNE